MSHEVVSLRACEGEDEERNDKKSPTRERNRLTGALRQVNTLLDGSHSFKD